MQEPIPTPASPGTLGSPVANIAGSIAEIQASLATLDQRLTLLEATVSDVVSQVCYHLEDRE